MQRPTRGTLLTTFAGVLTIGLAACGSSTSSSGGATSSLTGKPVKVMLINNVSSQRENGELYAAADAAASAINDAGGLPGGRPLVVVHCDDQITSDGTAKCARDAVNNPDIIALAGSYYSFSDQVDPALLQAGMANVGEFSQGIEDLTSAISFPTTSGALGSVSGMATLVTDVLNSKKISAPYVDAGQGPQVVQLLEGVLQTRGGQVVTKVPVPDHAPDLSSAVKASTANNPGGIILVLSVDSALPFVQAAQSQGVTIPLVNSGAEIGLPDLVKIGAAANGTYITTSFPTTGGAGNALFDQQMAKYAPSATKDDLAKNAWLGVRLFAAAAAKASALTRKGILDAMNALTSFDSGGLTPPLDYTKPFAGFGGTFPRMFNHTVVYNKVQDGKEIPITGNFADPFTPPGG
jgi:ABC-type branched-subunit amino acid transport system substrate-binding protein